ncbi:GGDEF domain-containing protein, partial [Mesorhizobium sp. M2E.F.Ca.ET.209.01.1.1]
MSRIFLRAAAVAFASVAASLLLTLIVVPAMGFPMSRSVWLASTVCPLVVAWAASASRFWQSDRLQNAHRELACGHAQLAAA